VLLKQAQSSAQHLARVLVATARDEIADDAVLVIGEYHIACGHGTIPIL
jgi:hypothetical protein